jgi:predicted phage terminase large subunit-like protein
MLKRRLNEQWLRSRPLAEQKAFYDQFQTEEERAALEAHWSWWARDEQWPPTGNWRIWLLMGGRGSGKTRAGAEWIADGVRSGTMRRIALLGATYHDARAVMVEGESGLLAIDKTARFEPSNHRVLWTNGAVATLLTAEEPDGIRGHNFDAAWGDEFCKWPAPQEALDMLRLALRTGDDPRLLLTTTPRNIKPLLDVIAASETKLVQMKTRDNANNLAPGFIAAMEQRYGGTALGRQEMDADLIEDNDAAPWRRDWIEAARMRETPRLTRVVVGVDPPASIHGDECGIVVAGLAEDRSAYVLADASAGGLSANGWARRVADTFARHNADLVIAESNQGGDMVKSVLLQQAPDLPVKLVHASRDKRTRAIPVAALYELARVHHAGVFPELEDQMCTYDDTGPSPDRMDALVYAITELLPPVPLPDPKVRTL